MSSTLLYREELGRRVLPQVDVEFGKSHNRAVAASCRLNFGAFNLDDATYAKFLLHGTGFFFIKP